MRYFFDVLASTGCADYARAPGFARDYIEKHKLMLSPALWRQVEKVSKELDIPYAEVADVMGEVIREEAEKVIDLIKKDHGISGHKE